MFTGADKKGKKGKFELADKGTLFIDEIQQLPKAIQPKLLRVLQEKEVDRIGSEKSIPVDVRIIVATNEDLHALMRSGKFREDLYYRLNVIEIRMPALRERPEDIPLLVEHFVDQFNSSLGKNVKEVDPQIYRLLMKYDWPGNVRELQNCIERAMNVVNGRVLSPEHFELPYAPGEVSATAMRHLGNPIEEVRQAAERSLIVRSLERFGGNKSKTAEYLKISRPLLYQKMKRLGIAP